MEVPAIVVTEELRERSNVGRELVEGEEAVACVTRALAPPKLNPHEPPSQAAVTPPQPERQNAFKGYVPIHLREPTPLEHRFWSIIVRDTVQTAKHFCQTVASRVQEDAPYDVFANQGMTADELQACGSLREMMRHSWNDDMEFARTYDEDVRAQSEVPDTRRVHKVVPPKVVARASLPTPYMCYCCGKHTGTDVQTPCDVFAVGYRLGGHELAMRCLKEMWELLEAENFTEVTRRTACCKMVSCMLAQNRLAAENYAAWIFSVPVEEYIARRPQLEKGTDRKDQGLELSDQMILIRCLAVQDPPVATREQLFALWRWVVAHSQFVQEREKRFIATALAVANNPHLFGYEFADPQSFVNRMAAFPRNYAYRILFPHLLRNELNRHKWKSGINKLLETAMPKPYDVIYALLCEDNWLCQNRPRDANGRPVHRVIKGAKHVKIFNVCYFKRGLKAAVATTKKDGEVLHFQDAASVGSESATIGTQREQRELNKLLTGTRKAGKTKGFGVADFPTCGSRQKTSSAHPADRYAAVFDAQGTYTRKEREDIVSLFIDTYEDGNTIGRELQDPEDPGSLSKACAVIRPVQVCDPPKEPTCLTRFKQIAVDQLTKGMQALGGDRHRPIGLGGATKRRKVLAP